LLAVDRDDAGPRVDAFERLLERQAPKLFYCQPCAHNPTGLTIRRDVAMGLLAAAARHQVPVMEDGFDGSLYYGERPPAPLKALDRHGVVVYIGTFSKVPFPGLRLGWLVAPAPLAGRAGARARRGLHAGRGVLGGRQRGAHAAAVVLLRARRQDR